MLTPVQTVRYANTPVQTVWYANTHVETGRYANSNTQLYKQYGMLTHPSKNIAVC